MQCEFYYAVTYCRHRCSHKHKAHYPTVSMNNACCDIQKQILINIDEHLLGEPFSHRTDAFPC